MEKDLFQKYVNLIRERAHKYSDKYGVDYYELESQGFLIYCECLENYDVSKSTFSTYLYIQLNRLGDYVKTYKRQQGALICDYYKDKSKIQNKEKNVLNDFDYEDNIVSKNYESFQISELLREAKELLSENAFALMKWIIDRSWEGKNKRKPTITMAANYFKLPKNIVEMLWEECRNFWNCEGFKIYA